MKPIKLILILFFTINVCLGEDNGKSGKTDYSAGFIDIIVKSNINSLVFSYDLRGKCILAANGIKTKYAYDTSRLRIMVPIRDFKCKNQFVYKDFLTLLKAEYFPYLEIAIPQNPCIITPANGSGILKDVSVSVAGVIKKYDINCRIENAENENEILLGTSRIRLTDFGIEPPVKFSGLVKVKDEIIVNFGFCLKNTGKAVNSI
jgi:hypothetical protein